jgi:hypothetical protein
VTDPPSWWWAQLGGLPEPRPPLQGDREADVCIVGAGYTGLWTAYELKRADPSLEVVVLEREVAGYGASGRNGGWVLGEVSIGSRMRAAASNGAIEELERAAQQTVDEVGEACAREEIACDFLKGGSLTVAQTAPQLARLRTSGRGELLDAERAAARGSSRPSSPAGSLRRSSAAARRSTSAHPPSRSSRTPCARPAARSAPAGWSARPRATPRRCPASGARCCRCGAR